MNNENTHHISAEILAATIAATLKQNGFSLTGNDVAASPGIAVDRLYEAWLEIDRPKPPVERYQKNAATVFRRFAAFMHEFHSNVREASGVTPQVARAFLKHEWARGIAEKTYNNILILLRTTFKELTVTARGARNPFEGIKRKRAEMIGRDCFSEGELEKIFLEARGDDFIGPIVITAATTAMRRGDCCLLRREAVDMDERLVRIKTRKTNQYVWIPMLPLLAEELKRRLARRQRWELRDYLFPEQATMYLENPDGITWRLKMLLRRAGVRCDEDDGDARDEDHGQRLRRPSRRGCHAFRTTWVTLALNHGVPEAVVLDVTGIRTIEIARNHYFNPQIAHYRSALGAKLPPILRTGFSTPGMGGA